MIGSYQAAGSLFPGIDLASGGAGIGVLARGVSRPVTSAAP